MMFRSLLPAMCVAALAIHQAAAQTAFPPPAMGAPGATPPGAPGAYTATPGAFPSATGAYPGATGAYPVTPGATAATPTMPGAYPGATGAYPGATGAYPMTPGATAATPTMPGAYPGATGAYPGAATAPGLTGAVQGLAGAITGATTPAPPAELMDADKAELRRFARSDWPEVTISAGPRTYYLRKTPTVVNYTISQGGTTILEGQMEIDKLFEQTKAAPATAPDGRPITSGVAGGTLSPLRVYRYEVIKLPTGATIVERVDYDKAELEQIVAADIAYYTELYRAYPPPMPTATQPAPGTTPAAPPQPADPSVYAQWYYCWLQLQLWEQYVQRLLRIRSGSKLPADVTQLPAVYPTLYDLYKQERDNVNQKQLDTLLALYENLRQREQGRNNYRQRQRDRLLDAEQYVENWASFDRSDTIRVDGVNYVRSDQPLTVMPENSVNVVAPALTPYDILNSDGSLKKPGARTR